MKHVSVTKNFIPNLDSDFFSGVTWLWSISITESFITSVDAGAFDVLENVSSIDISRNSLYTLPSNIMNKTTWERLTRFDFRGQVNGPQGLFYYHSLFCSCDLKWVAQWMLAKSRVFGFNVTGVTHEDYLCHRLFDQTRHVVDLATLSKQACLLNEAEYF
jgi:hypothetical protein